MLEAEGLEPKDPLHQILLAQLQQNQLLIERLTSMKNVDPILGALTGSGTDSAAASSSGVKGCMAREAFLKAAADLPRLALTAQANALKELGYGPEKATGDLMKKYMERRIPLADHKLLTYFATMCAEAWSVGHGSQNLELQGFAAKMLVFIEQASIDSGKYQLAWLLTGLQEPPFHLLVKQRWNPGLQPFARLCSPTWISANLAFLKGLDYAETRKAQIGKQTKFPAQEDDDEVNAANRKPRKQKGGKGKGKGSKADEPM